MGHVVKQAHGHGLKNTLSRPNSSGMRWIWRWKIGRGCDLECGFFANTDLQ